MMTQTLALLIDAYRELNSKKLFWITLVISMLVVVVFAAFGINEKGLTFLHWQFDTSPFDSKRIPPEKFYMFAFANIGVPTWLTWAASILALVSTASIFPDFIASGAIELTISKPISRLRLFLTKFATGLLFVGLQVLVFSLACFLVIGIRGGAWEWRLFLAVPIVLLFFSYLFSICVLFGLLTRSTIASILLTLLVWFGLWGVHTTDTIFVGQRETSAENVQRSTRRVERIEKQAKTRIETMRSNGEPIPGENGVELPAGAADSLEAVNIMLRGARKEVVESNESLERWTKWARVVAAVKTVVPKTADTIQLLDRWLLTKEDKELFSGGPNAEPDEDERARFGQPDKNVVGRVEAANRSRTVAWIIGTSLAFEGMILAIGAWVFCRREF